MKSFIILCGGRSTRMGQDKGLIPLKGQAIIIKILKRLHSISDEIILVLKDNEQIKEYQRVIKDSISDLSSDLNNEFNLDYNLKYLMDLEKDQGPLMGILTGLSVLDSEGALILPCDSPYISKEFTERILKLKDEYDSMVIVPQWPDGSLEPLHAYYRKECIPVIHKLLSRGVRDVRSLFEELDVTYIDVNVLDPEKSSFNNLNYPYDLEK